MHSDFDQIWRKLSESQRRFVVEAQKHPTKSEAARAIGINPNTVYQRDNELIDEAIRLIGDDIR